MGRFEPHIVLHKGFPQAMASLGSQKLHPPPPFYRDMAMEILWRIFRVKWGNQQNARTTNSVALTFILHQFSELLSEFKCIFPEPKWWILFHNFLNIITHIR